MNVAFRHLRPLVIIFLSVAAVGCAQHLVKPAIGAPGAPSTPTAVALQEMSPLLLRKARDLGYRPQILFCWGSGSSFVCYTRHAPGYRPKLYLCQTEMQGHLYSTDCIPAAHLAMTLQIENTQTGPPDAMVGGN